MKTKLYILTTFYFLLSTFFSHAQDVAIVKAYIEQYKTIAIAEMNRVGIRQVLRLLKVCTKAETETVF